MLLKIMAGRESDERSPYLAARYGDDDEASLLNNYRSQNNNENEDKQSKRFIRDSISHSTRRNGVVQWLATGFGSE
jgi:hypothetical protein